MKKEEYLKLVNEITPKPDRIKNCLYAFLTGGVLGTSCEIIRLILINVFKLPKSEACMWIGLILITGACFLTIIHKFDHLVAKYQAGLIVPTTGFAHSVQSTMLDYKKDGLITGIGSNTFKLAGSVIVYGVVSSFILVIVKVILGG